MKKIYIVAVITITLAVAGTYWGIQNKNPSDNENDFVGLNDLGFKNYTVETVNPVQEFSLADIVARPEAQFCQNAELLGQGLAIYSNGGRIRMETTTTMLNGEKKTINQLIMNGFQYIWPLEGNEASGSKLNYARLIQEMPETVDATKTFGMDIKYNINCSPQKVDEKKFAVPDGVIFDDITDKTAKFLQNLLVVP